MRHPLRPRTRGLSLVELLVAMAIGLVVVGVGASSYMDMATNTKNANAMAQMTEDANAALSILRQQVVLAGYSRPIGVTAPVSKVLDGVVTEVTTLRLAYTGIGTGGSNNLIYGCDGKFQDAKARELKLNELTCEPIATGATAPDAIAVVYEADASNTYPTATGSPTDCLGNAVPARNEAGLPAGLLLASNKFYIDTGPTGNRELYCQGNGRSAVPTADDSLPSSVTAQPIVENIQDMQIQYGVANTSASASGNVINTDAVAYLSASQLNSLVDADKWNRVVSVRICVEVRSASEVPSSTQTKYLNCQGQVANAPANRLARTFSTTVVVQNRIN